MYGGLGLDVPGLGLDVAGLGLDGGSDLDVPWRAPGVTQPMSLGYHSEWLKPHSQPANNILALT
jgi:hypothetical protein